MEIGNLTLENRVCLAPMAGVTDGPYRQLCRRYGAGLVYSEFLSSDGLVRGSMSQQTKITFNAGERPIGFQLFGAHSSTVAEAARMLCRSKPDLIDLNFGCPVKKVIKKNGGVAILKNLDLLEEIVGRTAAAIDRPLTVKMRAGYDDPVFVEAAQRAIRAGAQAIALHARVGRSGYAVPANWEFIRLLKEAVDVPVIGNGDIHCPADAAAMFEKTGCDMVMIGRAALGRPWIFRQVNEYLQSQNVPWEPSLEEKFEVLLWHLAEEIKLHGERRGLLRMRRHMSWYVRGLPGAAEFRVRMFAAAGYTEISRLLSAYREIHPEIDSRPPDLDHPEPEPLSNMQGPW